MLVLGAYRFHHHREREHPVFPKGSITVAHHHPPIMLLIVPSRNTCVDPTPYPHFPSYLPDILPISPRIRHRDITSTAPWPHAVEHARTASTAAPATIGATIHHSQTPLARTSVGWQLRRVSSEVKWLAENGPVFHQGLGRSKRRDQL